VVKVDRGYISLVRWAVVDPWLDRGGSRKRVEKSESPIACGVCALLAREQAPFEAPLDESAECVLKWEFYAWAACGAERGVIGEAKGPRAIYFGRGGEHYLHILFVV